MTVTSDRRVIKVTVVDTGAGIEASELVSVGHPFRTTKRNGTGLGLPIAKRIAEAHGGALRFESTAGVGTTVIVELPLAEST